MSQFIIDGIPVDSTTIANCYKMYYPETYKQLDSSDFIHYLHLWGIRVSTCDTSLPDDVIGGIRRNKFNLLENVISIGSTDPSPFYVKKPVDADAARRGGTAFIIEGQYAYAYSGKNTPKWKPYPAFCPIRRVPVYRWNASAADVTLYKTRKVPLSSRFAEDVRQGRIIKDSSADVCIHKATKSQFLYQDSAGCQVLKDYGALNILGDWAVDMRNKGFPNVIIYTLFSKEQFLRANTKRETTPRAITSMPIKKPETKYAGISSFLSNLFGGK